MKKLIPLIFLTGCLAKTVAPLATEHAAQTETIAERCRDVNGHGYAEAPCSKQLQSDLDAMTVQATCIEAIMHGNACDGDDGDDE
jgi:hypothetical protein